MTKSVKRRVCSAVGVLCACALLVGGPVSLNRPLQARASSIEDLQAQKEALDRVAALTSAVERESALEALILAKGFADCVVYIDGDHCHVVVKAEALDAGQSVQILEIVTTQSRVPAENSDIVAVNS